MDAYNEDYTICEYHDMQGEELMYVEIYSDSNDVEGIVWWGNKGSEWVSRANGEKSSGRF